MASKQGSKQASPAGAPRAVPCSGGGYCLPLPGPFLNNRRFPPRRLFVFGGLTQPTGKGPSQVVS
jgi:hypothetical protein